MISRLLLTLLCTFVCIFHTDAVNGQSLATESKYTYSMLTHDLMQLKNHYYDELELISIGKTHFGKEIWAIKLGKGKQNILLVGTHHGREWMTSAILVEMAKQYTAAYRAKKKIGEFKTDILDDVSIWFIPMLNPDGVMIQQGNFNHIPVFWQLNLLQMNGGSNDFSRWKANGLGIDLNRQYPAGWKESKGKTNVPYFQFYKGRKPLEAPEAKSLVQFTKDVDPLLVTAYHSSGREIYWNYKNGINKKRDYALTQKVADETGYKISKTPKKAYGAGFTDWFITKFHRPAMTVEISPYVGETSPPMSLFKDEWQRNRFVGILLATEVKTIFKTHKK